MTLINPDGREIARDITSLIDRQIKKQMAHNATIADVLDLSHQVAVQACNHLGNQIPAQIDTQCRTMVAEAMAALVQMLEERYVLTVREQTRDDLNNPSVVADPACEQITEDLPARTALAPPTAERNVPIIRVPFTPSPHIQGPDEVTDA